MWLQGLANGEHIAVGASDRGWSQQCAHTAVSDSCRTVLWLRPVTVVRAGSGLLSSCGSPGFQCVLVQLRGLDVGMCTAVEAGDRSFNWLCAGKQGSVGY